MSERRRGIFQKVPGSGVWWVRYVDAEGRYWREKAGTWCAARDLYIKRKNEALQGKKLPEKLRSAPATFREIAEEALAYSKAHKRSHQDDSYRMGTILEWFSGRTAESIAPAEIERALANAADEWDWTPATINRHRSLLSLVFRLAVRNGRVRENPVRQVARRKEDNLRVRFLDAEEEAALRAKIRELCPDREPDFDLALNTGVRRNEQWRLRWSDVNLRAGIITISETKNGQGRRVPINSVAEKALAALSKQRSGGYVVTGPAERTERTWNRWFEACVQAAGIADFRYHDVRHTFASRLAMAGVPLRTIAELLGHKTLAMVMRYAHLAPAHLRDAVERIAGTPTDTTVAPAPVRAHEQRSALLN